MDHIPGAVHSRVNNFQICGDPETPSDLAHARSFLRVTMKCTSLFSGDGFAYSETGKRGVQEWLVKRVAISDIPGVQCFTLLMSDLLHETLRQNELSSSQELCIPSSHEWSRWMFNCLSFYIFCTRL